MLSAGDLVILLQDKAHQLRDELHPPVRLVRDVPLLDGLGIERGGGGALTAFVWGGFRFEHCEQNRLLEALPPVIHVPSGANQGVPWLDEIIRFILHETDTYEPGASSVIDHLAHVLFIHAVRVYVSTLPVGSAKYPGALLDPEIGTALSLIHTRAKAPWTVGSLADSVAMSRSAFAARFCSLIGEPPLQYLTSYRMATARALLREGRSTVKAVSAHVGYDSEASFSKAFKRRYGVSPGSFHREEIHARSVGG